MQSRSWADNEKSLTMTMSLFFSVARKSTRKSQVTRKEKECVVFEDLKSLLPRFESLKNMQMTCSHLDVDDVLISGHERRRLQKANEGRSSGVGTGWTGDRGWRNEPWRLGSIDCDDSCPLDDVRLSEPLNGAVAVGDGTFSIKEKG